MTFSSKVAFLIPLYAQVNQMKLLEKYGRDVAEYTAVSTKDLYKDVFSNNRQKLQERIKNRHRAGNSKDASHISL